MCLNNKENLQKIFSYKDGELLWKSMYRIENLRSITHKENCANMCPNRTALYNYK